MFRSSPQATFTGCSSIGNTSLAYDTQPVRKAANINLFKVDAALGIHHAKSSRKNFILMVGSFGLSIVLFLAFSVITSAGKDRKAAGDGRIWTQEADDAAISA